MQRSKTKDAKSNEINQGANNQRQKKSYFHEENMALLMDTLKFQVIKKIIEDPLKRLFVCDFVRNVFPA